MIIFLLFYYSKEKITYFCTRNLRKGNLNYLRSKFILIFSRNLVKRNIHFSHTQYVEGFYVFCVVYNVI